MQRLLLVITVVLAACSGTVVVNESSGESPAPATTSASVLPATTTTTSTTTTTTTIPVTAVVHDAGSTEIEGIPTRIAALSSVHVEMLFAVGAGDQVIAGDLFSNYPEAANDLIKIDSFNINVEEVIALEPDLVTLSFDPGGVLDALTAVGIPTLLFGTALDIETAYSQIESLGMATGHPAEAQSLTEEMAGEISSIASEYGPALGGVTFYHEVDSFSFYTPNSASFIGSFYELLGMVNIADAAPDEFGSGFPQLSPEFIVDSDPFVIVRASFGETADSLAVRDGFDAMTAVAEGRVLVIDSEAAGRWGPRIVSVFREIAKGVDQYVP